MATRGRTSPELGVAYGELIRDALASRRARVAVGLLVAVLVVFAIYGTVSGVEVGGLGAAAVAGIALSGLVIIGGSFLAMALIIVAILRLRREQALADEEPAEEASLGEAATVAIASHPGQEQLAHRIERLGVGDRRLLAALRAVPRAAFVAADSVHDAYVDEPLAIPHNQVTTQPSLIAKMLAALELTGEERVLEIGTGYGFQTALLAELAASVWSIERWPDIAMTARAKLHRFGARNVDVVVGDGSEGLPDHAPYDAIVVSAAYPSVPEPLVEQLRWGGRLVQPIGEGGAEDVVVFEKSRLGRLRRRESITGAHFVRLHGRHGYPDA